MGTKIIDLLTQRNASPARRIAYSFFMVILIGAILLMLPISNQDGMYFPFIDALFTATSATCVTGLVGVTVSEQFTIFGQSVILVLIQIGGLSLMVLMASFLLLLKNKLTMQDKIAIKELLNQSHITDFKKFLRGILQYTFILEFIGALFLLLVFIPESSSLQDAIFTSIFTSVSAFCNAGFDTLGSTSLYAYNSTPLLLIVVMCLIILGGLGFVVWFNIYEKLYLLKKRKFRHFFKSLNVHTKIVLVSTLILILVPAIFFFFMEYNQSMQDLTLIDKIINSLFTSVTLRTAGFASVMMHETTMASQLIMLICMFIGGSPAGTAGGIKTTTIAIIILSILANLKDRDKVAVFNRTISNEIVVRATTILAINLMVLLLGILVLCMSEDFLFMEIVYEAISALATVGLSLGITSSLSVVGKIVIIMLMFVGRIGIMTFIMSFVKEERNQDKLEYASGQIIVG